MDRQVLRGETGLGPAALGWGIDPEVVAPPAIDPGVVGRGGSPRQAEREALDLELAMRFDPRLDSTAIMES